MNEYKDSIIRIDLIFDNRKMIRLLTERGEAIKDENTSKIETLEKKIQIHLQ